MDSKNSYNPKSSNNSKVDDWAYMISILAGPLTLLIAAIIAIVAASPLMQDDSRAKDLTQFATLLLTGGAAVTGTTQPRKTGTTNVDARGENLNLVGNVEEYTDQNNNKNATPHQKETTVN